MNSLRRISLRMRLTVLTMAFVFLIAGALLLLLNHNASNQLISVALPLQKIYVSEISGDNSFAVKTADETFLLTNSRMDDDSINTEQYDVQYQPNEAMPTDENNLEVTPMQDISIAKAEMASVVLTTAAKDIRQYSYWVFFSLILLSGCLVYYWCGKVLKPVQELSLEMHKRTINNLNVPIRNENAVAEMKQLSDAFNDMIQNLNQSFDMQKQFNANAAHELRTPIAVLQANIEAMEEEPEQPVEEYQAFIEIAKRTVSRMASLVENLLQMTQLEQIEKPDFIHLPTLLQRAANEAEQIAQEKDVSINFNFSNGDYYIKGNETLFLTAVSNLIENGIKYNQNGGSVCIKLVIENDMAIIVVSDTGRGIPVEEMDAIFEPFYRVDKSRARGLGGAGMGLSLVRHIAKCHGGSVLVKSEMGMGSSFSLQVPLWIRAVY